MHHGDGQGLPVQCPSPDGDHKSNGIHQSTLLKVNRVGNLTVGNLYDRRWRCKFSQMVLQC